MLDNMMCLFLSTRFGVGRFFILFLVFPHVISPKMWNVISEIDGVQDYDDAEHDVQCCVHVMCPFAMCVYVAMLQHVLRKKDAGVNSLAKVHSSV